MNSNRFRNVIEVKDLDFVMLSFDEENADAHFADLLLNVPWAKRSHGVKGIDAAHRAAAAMSETEHFVTIDADNIIDPAVLDFKIYNPNNLDKFAVSLNGINYANGLMYGNGSIKIWTKSFINEMNCHEQSGDDATERKATDFCWEPTYFSTRRTCYSITITNASAYQGWRSGFREGVKKGIQYKENMVGQLHNNIVKNNLQIFSWAMLGSDVEHGGISADGSVLGFMMYLANLIPTEGISDYVWLENFYKEQWPEWERKMDSIRASMGALFGLPTIPLLDPFASRAMKHYSNIESAKEYRLKEWEIE